MSNTRPSPTAHDAPAVPSAPIRPRRDPALALEADEFRRIGHDLVDRIAGFLESLPARRVTAGESPDAVRVAVRYDAAMPERGEAPGELIDAAANLLFEHSLFNGHPRFLGYITSPPAPIGILGEFLAAAVNANAGAWILSPAASEIEGQAIRWIADLIGYRRGCGGLLVSGGNMANFVGLLAARAARASWNIRQDGLAAPGATTFAIYASRETHTWIQKGADLFGLGTGAIRWIDTDAALRMDVDALDAALADDASRGITPLMVVGTAGSVSTGAVDPLRRIAETCRRVGAWFHVDGAYGGFAAAVPGASPEFAALREADSVAIDPHKWLYAPLEAGCILARSPEVLRSAFSYHPPYYHFGVEATNYVDLGLQNSRGFRALKVWLALRHAGREGYARMIGDDIRLAERLFVLASRHPQLEAVTQGLSIATFRFVPADLRTRIGDPAVERYLDALNEALLDDLQRGGAVFVSNAVVSGRFVLRACIVNFHTTDADVAAIPGIVVDAGQALDARMRSQGLASG